MEDPIRPSDGDRNRESSLLACFWILFTITVPFVCARLFVRLKIQSLGLDDYAMFLAWVLNTATTAMISVAIVHGGSRHLFYLTPDEHAFILKYMLTCEPLGSFTLAFGISSVGFLILRIIGPNTIWRKWFVYCSVSLYMVITLVNAVTTFAQCSPMKAQWESVAVSRCWNPTVNMDISLLQSAYGAFMSFVFAAMPITIIHGLQMSLKKKFGLCILLGLGFFAGICSAIKTAQLLVLSSRRDLTWDTYALWLWTFIENALVIVCGCIPTLKPLYDKVVKGKPIRAARSHHNGKGPYQVYSNPSESGKTKLVAQPEYSTNVTSRGANDNIELREIRVERTVDVDHCIWDSTSGLEARASNVF